MKPESQRQIMIGGDEHTLSESTKSGLKAEGYHITFCEDLMDLNNKASESGSVCALIVDGDTKAFTQIKMLSEAFAKRQSKRPLLLLTAHYSLTAIAKALQAGFDEFLAKQVGEEELIALINKHETKTK